MAPKKSEKKQPEKKKATKNETRTDVKKAVKSPAPKPVKSSTTKAEPVTDRVIRPSHPRKNIACPECKAFPTVTKIRRGDYELRRCRECGHRFEVKKGGR
jgi:DNA-directed RNA polymerase subunit M/transcription elongation factor TFIIS